jgi:hypothetical protein
MFKKIAKKCNNSREKLDQRVERGDKTKNYRANNQRRLYTG